MPKLTYIAPLPDFRLDVRYDDGTHGVVDLSDLAGRGVFAAWQKPDVFESVAIGTQGQLVWGDEIELCADAVYLRLTGKAPEDVFPSLKQAHVDA